MDRLTIMFRNGAPRVNQGSSLRDPPSPKATAWSSSWHEGRHHAEADGENIPPGKIRGAPAKADEKGYTLIELIVVIVLIGLLMSFTIPRFQDSLFTDNLKGTTRNMVGLIHSLREDAISEQRSYYLWFDLEMNRYWVTFSDMTEGEKLKARDESSPLSNGVEIREIRFSDENRVMRGEVGIHFDKKGYVQPSEIHLGSDDGREFTLVLSPFLREVKIIETE